MIWYRDWFNNPWKVNTEVRDILQPVQPSEIDKDHAAQAAADAAAKALAKLSNMKPLEQRSNRGQNEEF